MRTNDARASVLLRDTLARIEALDAATQARPEYLRPHAILVGNRGLLHQLRGELAGARRTTTGPSPGSARSRTAPTPPSSGRGCSSTAPR